MELTDLYLPHLGFEFPGQGCSSPVEGSIHVQCDLFDVLPLSTAVHTWHRDRQASGVVAGFAEAFLADIYLRNWRL